MTKLQALVCTGRLWTSAAAEVCLGERAARWKPGAALSKVVVFMHQPPGNYLAICGLTWGWWFHPNSTTWPYLSASEKEQCWLKKGPSLQFISSSELKHGHCSAPEDGTEMPEGDTDGESVWWPLEAGTEWTGRRAHPLTAHFDQSSNMADWVRKLELTYKLYYEIINVWILLWGD